MVTEKMIKAAFRELMRQDAKFAWGDDAWAMRVIKPALEAALSAQVQDVADTEIYYTTENNWENMFFGPGASTTEKDDIWDFAKQAWATADFKITATAAPAAKLEEKP